MKTLSIVTICLCLASAAFAVSPVANTRPVILTGEIQATDAMPVVMPPSNNNPALIRYFVEEGASVKKGDVVLRVDANAAGTRSALQSQLALTRERNAREIAALEVAAERAHIALVAARALADKAALDQQIPKQHLSALDFDRYAGEAERTARDATQKTKAHAAALDDVARKREEARLDIDKATIELAFLQAELARAEVRATTSGILTHAFNDWRGRRYDQGENANSGSVVGQIFAGDRYSVRAFALEADRNYLRLNQPVEIRVDALPGVVVQSNIAQISETPEPRAAWGDGRYFRIEIPMPVQVQAQLVVGMSVQVRPTGGAINTQQLTVAKVNNDVFELEGELAAALTQPISPPSITDTWQLTLQMLAPEGSIVGPDRPAAVFDGQSLQRLQQEKSGRLEELRRTLDKLALTQAEQARADALALASAVSLAEKAARKAAQPKSLVGGIAYKKLLIEKAEAQQQAVSSKALLLAQDRQRSAEFAEQKLQQTQLEQELADLKASLEKMAVKPSLRGMLIHLSDYSGDKFSSGSQVYVGQTVAMVADLSTLRVNAWVPEALASRVAIGQRVEVMLSSGARTLPGKVSSLGRTFRSKSRAQPVIVRDVIIELEDKPTEQSADAQKSLRPGAPVRVRVLANAGAASLKAGP